MKAGGDGAAGPATVDQLPIAMRYRQLRLSAKRRLQVRRSRIEGLGLWALEDIEVAKTAPP